MPTRRTIITLPEEDKAWLEEYGKLHRISMAEGLRLALRLFRESREQSTYQSLVQETQGIRSGGDGLDAQCALRAEWIRHD